jgi:broad specificity phosphatase PhoE
MRVADAIHSATNTPRIIRRDESTTVLLIRHGHTTAIDRWLCGRQQGITLSGLGVVEAEELGQTLAACCHLAAIYSSPLERARDTADAIARYQRSSVQQLCVDICDALNEIDFGAWTGKTFDELDADPRWQAFNRTRASATIPGGESPHAAQHRIVAAITHVARDHRGKTVALVSHAEIVRMALLHYQAISLDHYHELEILPASVSAVSVSPDGTHVQFVNRCAAALRP